MMRKKDGTDGIRNNQAMPEVPKEQQHMAATDPIDDVVEAMMDKVEETFFAEEEDQSEDEDESRRERTLWSDCRE